MCGIAGAFGGLSRYDIGALSDSIIQAISYRGPDGHAVERFDSGFFVHLRLAIIDLSEGGAQPKWSADRRYCLTYNGELYNYKELRSELSALGHGFSTDSDSEVLIKVWEVWGAEGLTKCIGMYAFALFDTQRKELHLARDPYGIKPLYVAKTNGGLRFASTYTALSRFPDCPRRIDARYAFEFARYGRIDHLDGTMVAGVRPIEPGMVETWDVSNDVPALMDRKVRCRPVYNSANNTLTFEQAVEALREAFLLSIRLHMRSDVPIGFALSGGIDSSAIVCAARMIEPGADLNTFTYVAEGNAVDESHWANTITDHVRAKPHLIRMTSTSAVDSLDELVRAHGSPCNSMGQVAQYRVFQAGHEAGVTVMLDGQGGDELFGGYLFHLGAALAGYIRRGDAANTARLALAASRVARVKWWTIGAWSLDHLLPRGIKHLARSVAGFEHLPDWINPRWVNDRGGADVATFAPGFDRLRRDVLGERMAYDLTDLVIPDLLLFEDRNSMRHSIESRVPFLSSPVSTLAYSVPSHYHIGPDAVSKRLLRAALRGIVPDEIRLRRDKVGFEVPQGDWLFAEHDKIEAILDSDVARSIGLFNHDKLMARWHNIDGPTHRDFLYIWRWMGLILWTSAFDIQWA
jgi:asparagine synthase (glutamine-hydrolysing)